MPQWSSRLNKNIIIAALFAGCLYSQSNVEDPLSISDTCLTTCFTETVISYICDQSSSSPLGSTTCISQATWDQTCTPAGK